MSFPSAGAVPSGFAVLAGDRCCPVGAACQSDAVPLPPTAPSVMVPDDGGELGLHKLSSRDSR